MTSRPLLWMSWWLTLLANVVAISPASVSAISAPQPALAPPRWLTVEIGIVGPAAEDILVSALSEAQRKAAQGLVIELDTPGGDLAATRSMVKKIMAAPLPVLVWVGPAGSHAASAGAFLALAAHVVAMAPGTNIGAAHPVQANGEDLAEDELGRKVTNDTLAFIESIAQKRGRNVDVARSFVATSLSLTDDEALTLHVIDLVAPSLASFLNDADGRVVQGENGQEWTLKSRDAVVERYAPSFRQNLLTVLSHPDLFYLLFMAGLIGLGYELTHPGMMLPGVAGGICMLLALIATAVLPVSYGAACLILFGVAMLVAEAFLPSFGVLGVGGLVSLVFGSVFLVDPSDAMGLRVSWQAIAPGVSLVALAFFSIGWLVLRSRRQTVLAGREAMVGMPAEALAAFHEGRGQVRANGAIWSARLLDDAHASVQVGDALVVKGIVGLILEVEKA